MVLDNNIANKVLLDNYLGLLNGLSRECKIKLVESLNFEIAEVNDSKNDWIDTLYGSFISDKSAEDMISEIRSDRRFTNRVYGF
jgi:hypothetical protein